MCVWECRAVLVYGKRANADRKHKKKTGKLPVFYLVFCCRSNKSKSIKQLSCGRANLSENIVFSFSPLILTLRDRGGQRMRECVHVGVLCTVE